MRILLITSRDTGRWIIPKGWMMPGKTAQQAAGIEAWEEAGAEGRIGQEALGGYSYTKRHAKNVNMTANVRVYPLRVDRLAPRYPESGQRERRWMSPKKAASAVLEPALKQIILDFNPARHFEGSVSPW